MPRGFSNDTSGSAENGPMSNNTAPTAATVQATNFQRREGGRPLGNNSKSNDRRVRATTNPTVCPKVEIVRGASSDPGSTAKA